MAYTLNGTTLPNVSRESIRKGANFLVLNTPRSDADSAWVFDFLGVTCKINIEGVAVGTSQISDILGLAGGTDLVGGLIDGSQDSSVTYTGSNSISVSVLVDSIDLNVDVINTENMLHYSINMVMGKGSTD